MKARVLTTPRANAEAHRAARWWRKNRKAAPYLFEDELAKAIELLSEQPEAGRRITQPALEDLRALLLQRSRYHVYYEHDASAGKVVIRAIWSAVRGRPPRIRPRPGG